MAGSQGYAASPSRHAVAWNARDDRSDYSSGLNITAYNPVTVSAPHDYITAGETLELRVHKLREHDDAAHRHRRVSWSRHLIAARDLLDRVLVAKVYFVTVSATLSTLDKGRPYSQTPACVLRGKLVTKAN